MDDTISQTTLRLSTTSTYEKPSVSHSEQSWELATESIVVRIRWFGIAMGYVLVQTRTGLHDPSAVRAFLALGAGYAALDTVFYRLGEVFLKRFPLFVSLMESLFIGLLCYHDTGLDSPFRWYYLLSVLCCAMRYRRELAWITCGFHALSFLVLARTVGANREGLAGVALTLAILVWLTWAASALATILRATGQRLAQLNNALERNAGELERRVAERTAALRASEARSIQQEKMAAFGLLAAGIAHEVGNPLAALSSLIQILQRRNPDEYTSEKLDLAGSQLTRIQRTLRELVDFARPASKAVTRFKPAEVIDEALGIAKYYHRTKDRVITTEFSTDLPPVRAVRDHLTQVVLNLVLNALDATKKGGLVHLSARSEAKSVLIEIADDGPGIKGPDQARLFQPYFTTKAQGTGLGLFVSRQMVEESGGTLTHRSELGQGAIFTIQLPADHGSHLPTSPGLLHQGAGA